MLPGPLQYVGQTAISTGENSLQIAGLDIMPVVGNGAVPPEGIPQQVYPALILLPGDLGLPLEGGVGLGHKPRGRHGDPHTPGPIGGTLPPGEIDLAGQVGNAKNVLVRLSGQSQHEVQLDAVPSPGKGGADGLHQVLLPQVFVDGVPQALRTRLRRKGQAAFTYPLQPFHQPHREGIRPKGGQGETNVPRLAIVQKVVAQLHQAGVVCGG